MPTTTVRLPEALKARIARAAERAGTTPHGFILEAIAEKTERHERRDAFHELAEERFRKLVASGKTVAWKDLCGYLEKRLAGRTAKRPTAAKTTR